MAASHIPSLEASGPLPAPWLPRGNAPYIGYRARLAVRWADIAVRDSRGCAYVGRFTDRVRPPKADMTKPPKAFVYCSTASMQVALS